MTNLFANQENGVIALSTKTWAELGFDDNNIVIVYELGNSLKSWKPLRTTNGIPIGVTSGASYVIIPKINIDATAFFAPPIQSLGDGNGFYVDAGLGHIGLNPTNSARGTLLRTTTLRRTDAGINSSLIIANNSISGVHISPNKTSTLRATVGISEVTVFNSTSLTQYACSTTDAVARLYVQSIFDGLKGEVAVTPESVRLEYYQTNRVLSQTMDSGGFSFTNAEVNGEIGISGNIIQIENNRLTLNSYENDEEGAFVADATMRVQPGDTYMTATYDGKTGTISAAGTGAGASTITPNFETRAGIDIIGDTGVAQLWRIDNATGSVNQYIRVGEDGGKMEIRDDFGNKGLVYTGDYSDNWDDRSLVDKAYVNKALTWVTPEQFGAKGDGVTDDTTAFVDMAQSVTNDSNIRLKGNYIIQSNLVAFNDLSNITIDASGAVILAPDNEAPAFLWAFEFTDCSFVTWIKGTFDRKNSVTIGTRQIGIRVDSCTDFNFETIFFKDCYFGVTTSNVPGANKRINMSKCVIIGPLDYTSQRDTDFVLSENLIYLPAAEECTFYQCASIQTGHLLIEDSTTDCKYNSVVGCICRDAHDSGIYMKGLASKVVNCYVFDAGKDPIKHLGSGLNGQHVLITGNHIERAGIHKTDGGTYINAVAPGAIISGNTIILSNPGDTQSPSHTAILFASNSSVSNNTIHGVGPTVVKQIGVQPAPGNVDNASVFNNKFYDIRNGLEFDPASSRKYQNINVSGNTFSNVHTGILIYQPTQTYDGSLFTGLVINNNTFSGYSFGASIHNVEKAKIYANTSALQTGYTNGTFLYYNGCKDVFQMNNITDGLETTYSQKLTYNTQATTLMVSTNNFKAATLQDLGVSTFNVVKINGISPLLDLRAQVNYGTNVLTPLRFEGTWITTKDLNKVSCAQWGWESGTAAANNSRLILSSVQFNSYTNPDGYSTTPSLVTELFSFSMLDGSFAANKLKVNSLNAAPSSSTDTGVAGEIRITAGFIYVCSAANTWVRTALTTF